MCNKPPAHTGCQVFLTAVGFLLASIPTVLFGIIKLFYLWADTPSDNFLFNTYILIQILFIIGLIAWIMKIWKK